MRANLTPLDAAQLARQHRKGPERAFRPMQTFNFASPGTLPDAFASSRQIFNRNLFVLTPWGAADARPHPDRAVQMRTVSGAGSRRILDTVLLFGYMTPLFLMLVIPIACMLSVFLTFLRMSTDRRAGRPACGGINIYQMLPAPLLFSVIMLLTL